MRGLLILLSVLALAASGLLYLFWPDHRDLEVLEDRIAEVLDRCERELLKAQRNLDALRALKPNVIGLERELDRLRLSLERHRRRLSEFAGSRPGRGEDRGSHLEARRAARREAETLLAGVEDLGGRVRLALDFARDVQPRVQRMLHAFGGLYERADRLRAQGRLPEDLSSRISYLRDDVRQKRTLARSAFETATKDASQGRILVETARNEVERLLGEIEALSGRLDDIERGEG